MKNASLSDIDSQLAAAVERAAPSVVRVEAPRRSTSGIVFGDGDLVLTSARALRHRDALRVADHAGTVREASFVGRDRATDVAVLRLSEKLEPLAFRDPDGLATGHLTLALGRPGRAIRASLRIVGVLADGMDLPWGGRLDRYVETDRGLPHGFAGGPLIDLAGDAIGMSSDRILRGTDLAVPVATLTRVVDAIVTDGGVKRGYLGVAVRPVRLPSKLQETLEQTRGALIVAVEEGSPAESSGLVIGDVLVSIGGDPITGPRSLSAALRIHPSTSVDARLLRAGAMQQLTLTSGERV